MKLSEIIDRMCITDTVEIVDYQSLDTLYYGIVTDVPFDCESDPIVTMVTASNILPTTYNKGNPHVVIYIVWE